MSMHLRTSISFVLVFVVLIACNRQTHNSDASLFPASSDATEWKRTSDVRTFAASDLWKYIDGEAEKYVSAGVQAVSTADYRFDNKYDAVVDIYGMAAAAGVEKILASESADGAKPVQLGDSARLYGQSLIFRKGPYLVRITAYQEAPEMKSALLVLGRAVEANLRK
jgi:hypothetical protein